MAHRHQFVSQSDSGKSVANRSKGQHETMIPKVRHPSFHPSWKNSAVMGQVRNLQNRLLTKESSLKELKFELEKYKENYIRQSSQNMTLKDHIVDLKDINASASRIKFLKNIRKLKVWDRCQYDLLYKEKQMSTIEQSPFTLNWETQTTQTQHQSFISKLATLLRNTFITVPATEEAVRERIQEISMNEQSWRYKTDVLQQEIQLLTRQVEQLHQLCQEVVCHSSQSEEKFLEQKKSLKISEGKSATDYLFQGNWNLDKKKSIAWSNRENLNPTGDQVMMGREGGYDSSRNIFMSLLRQKHMSSLGCQTLLSKNVPDPKRETQREINKVKTLQAEELNKKFRKLEKEKRQQLLLAVENRLPNTATLRLEEKVQKLQKDLSDMKLSNQNMKTQLTRVNYLKDKTIDKLGKYLQKIETIKEKTSTKSPLDPPLEAGPSPNRMLYFKRGANSVHTDFAGLLVKNKTLQTEVKNLQNRLLMKESSLKEMKFELEKYKENYIRQSSQNLTWKDHIRDLEKINASGSRIKSLKNINIQNLEKGNWDLSERVVELESHLRVQLIEREKAKEKAAALEKKLVDAIHKLASFMNLDMEGQDDSPEVLVKKDKTIDKLGKYLQMVETIKEKTSKKVTNLKTTLNYTEPEAREDKERVYQMLKAVTNELYTLLDFRESVMKMMGFNIKTPDKEIINQLKPIIETYEISLITSNIRLKVPGDCKISQGNE
ncbi:uncharacterized protein LOC141522917 [Macrotis lagotis]|uniref:uncharacterized protein LOC141522917 n=1 Tax=Macrotis lagotis TaxID=92651 RepID=UPI003D68A2D0